MSKQLKSYIDDIFAPYQHLEAARELKEELEVNLTEKFRDYKHEGCTDAEAFEFTRESIGDISELLETIDPAYKTREENSGILPNVPGPFDNGIMAASVYAILFVALMVVLKGTITRDGIVMPAVALFAVISLMQYFVKGNSKQPRWLVVGSFIIGVLTASSMAIILH